MNQQTPLVKMNGIGNKILVLDLRLSVRALEQAAVLALAANRQTDFDQIMAIYPPRTASSNALIEIWNKDGTKARACGNGMRCVVAYLAQLEGGTEFHFESDAHFIYARYLGDGRVEVDMGKPSFDWRDIPTTRSLEDTLHVDIGIGFLHDGALVSMGNPHCIFFVSDAVDKIALEQYGPILEHDALFAERANISLARPVAYDQMQLRTWERGVGLTLACGSAACAAVAAAIRRDLSGRCVKVHLPGGDLHIEWDEKTDHLLMSGATQYEFSGHVDPTTGQFEKI